MSSNNPMGSRRRKRFYHRMGVVPVIREIAKVDFSDPNFYRYEMQPIEREEVVIKPSASFIQHGVRSVRLITVESLHNRLCDIMDSMIAMAEEADRKIEKLKNAEKGVVKDDDQGSTQTTAQRTAAQESAQKAAQEAVQEAGASGGQPFNDGAAK